MRKIKRESNNLDLPFHTVKTLDLGIFNLHARLLRDCTRPEFGPEVVMLCHDNDVVLFPWRGSLDTGVRMWNEVTHRRQ